MKKKFERKELMIGLQRLHWFINENRERVFSFLNGIEFGELNLTQNLNYIHNSNSIERPSSSSGETPF